MKQASMQNIPSEYSDKPIVTLSSVADELLHWKRYSGQVEMLRCCNELYMLYPT